jgi:hypothetical protein
MVPTIVPYTAKITTTTKQAPLAVCSYANAVSLLERYVPVTGFMNGVFGMVAGAACMVGPVAVAMLAKHTALG